MQIECKGVILNKKLQSPQGGSVHPVLVRRAHSGDGICLCSLSTSYAAVGPGPTPDPLWSAKPMASATMWVNLAPGGVRVCLRGVVVSSQCSSNAK